MKYGNKNEKKEKRSDQMTKHHLLPRSRGGGNGENLVAIPWRFHEAWHVLFGRLTPEEAIRFIKIVFLGNQEEGKRKRKKRKTNWKAEELYVLQLRLQLETYERK